VAKIAEDVSSEPGVPVGAPGIGAQVVGRSPRAIFWSRFRRDRFAVAGIVFLSVAGWFMATFQTAYAAATGGPRATFALIIDLAYRILFVALIVRVVAAWFGMFRYSRWIRPAYILTDWLVEPIRRIVPNVGAFDFSPVVAVVVLSLLRQIVLSALSR